MNKPMREMFLAFRSGPVTGKGADLCKHVEYAYQKSERHEERSGDDHGRPAVPGSRARGHDCKSATQSGLNDSREPASLLPYGISPGIYPDDL